MIQVNSFLYNDFSDSRVLSKLLINRGTCKTPIQGQRRQFKTMLLISGKVNNLQQDSYNILFKGIRVGLGQVSRLFGGRRGFV